MMNAIEWNELFSNVEEVDEMVTIFTEKILSIARESIPTKIVTIRGNDKHWFNSNIRKAIRIRDRLRKKSIKSKKETDINKYKKQRNKVNNTKKEAKENLRKTWKI